MLDDASTQRGIEDYIPRNAPRYPARFYSRLVEIPAETVKRKQAATDAGQDPDAVEPYFIERDFVEVALPGGDTFDGEVQPHHKANYPREWAAYKRGEQFQDGTPIAQWATMPQQMKLRLQTLNIFTLEAFINCDGPTLQQVGPEVSRYQAEARRFLGASAIKAREQKEAEKEARIAELEAKLERMTASAKTSKEKREI